MNLYITVYIAIKLIYNILLLSLKVHKDYQLEITNTFSNT